MQAEDGSCQVVNEQLDGGKLRRGLHHYPEILRMAGRR